ncbi:MAG TPA: glycoside hydrolase family 57 protein [Syntrophorhabdaceae bacterium]|nr:glycoside hydrolase family 57 protein [Syntrophorhabdaceae bacterium]
MEPVYISFLWHMHQPYYKNLFTGEYLLPWVLLHGTKDYYDMAAIVKEFPAMRQNFNLVPSLLAQLFDYENLEVNDSYVSVFNKEPKDLTASDKIFILTNFFNANWDNMIRPFPRYYELLRKRGFYYPKDGMDKIVGYFTDEELRDIQMFFFLAWIDPTFFELHDDLKYLKSKGRLFSEDDKKTLVGVQKMILKSIIPLYRELALSGQIELSTSPFYHPIIPLLIDSRSAKESMPNVALPDRPFARPDDASRQIGDALTLFKEIFGNKPRGVWPPEGSVSDDALALYMDHDVKWLATDEDILFESLNWGSRRDGNGFLSNPEILYKPYRYERREKEIQVIFRDQSLSDLISFHYSRMDAKDAASDCLRRIRTVRDSLRGKIREPLITIAMDGENAWENYKNDGRDFLKYLYEGILSDSGIVPTTISDYLSHCREFGELHHCFAGSWIGHNFSIWIGHSEDNAGWTELAETRDFLDAEDPGHSNAKAWESIYIAEGSDWFWWYGDEHSSENDEIFDFLFRENLSNVYRFLNKQPPEILSIPIIVEDRETRPTREPINFIHPQIDGRVTNYFEWIGAGYLEGRGHGVAMHETVSLIKGCYYGFDESNLFLRLDIDKTFVSDMADLSFEINIMARTDHKILYHLKTGVTETGLPVRAAFTENLEVMVPFDALGVSRKDKLNVWLSLKVRDMIVDRIPKRGYLSISVPSETFEAEMWYV